MSSKTNSYGIADNSYKAAGELSGIIKLVDTFYDFMDEVPETKKIRDMHPDDLSESRKKLAYFLSGWLGGPKLYSEHFGKMSLPNAHQHLDIGLEERDAWINCMQKAVDLQPYDDAFKAYLIEKLRIPAERIRTVCST